MTKLLGLLLLMKAITSCQVFEAKESFKLYKSSGLTEREWYLVLDMKYFGSSIQEEECERLRQYYSSVNGQRKFRCIKSDNANDPISL